MPRCKCCVPGCDSLRKDVTMHKFPKSEIGFNQWLNSINCDSLRSLELADLDKRLVCHKHFERKFLINSRLKQNAFPTLFSVEEMASGTPCKPIEYSDHKPTDTTYVIQFVQQDSPQEQMVDELKKKWKNLKDNYRKELKKNPVSRSGDPGSDYKSSWKYFELMGFLKDECMPTEGDTNLTLEPQTNEENETQHLTEDDQSSQPHPSPAPQPPISPISPPPSSTSTSRHSSETTNSQTAPKRKRPNELRAEYLEIEKKKLKLLELEAARTNNNNEEINSDDYHFLMSLLPQMEKLNIMQKMRLRQKFNQALIEEIALNENHYGYYTQPTNYSYPNNINQDSIN